MVSTSWPSASRASIMQESTALAVQQHGAGAAGALVAGHFQAGVAQPVPQDLGQGVGRAKVLAALEDHR